MSSDCTPIIDETASVPPEQDSRRADVIAAWAFPGYSRTQLTRWIRSGELRVDGAGVRPSQALKAGQRLHLRAQAPRAVDYRGEPAEYACVYEDEHILVVDKPAGLVVHPGAGIASGTLANALIHDRPELRGLPRAGIVHRLDAHTSGLMVIAKDLRVHSALVQMMQERSVERRYLALVHGVLIAGGEIEAPIGRHPRHRTRQAVVKGGRWARTHYRVRERFRHHTLIECRLETGRTHQIRVHCAHAGFALVGDATYGAHAVPRKDHLPAAGELLRDFRRQALCAHQLDLEHPITGRECSWSIEPPEDLRQLIDVLRCDADGNHD
ncbi:MAG: RluA family pseudouridine synthase [Gammaproteobacteria bacterium AqS3]|nr:RluA family pseudouridine synthase [Gammaproteobacteria bacterium AqS3]